jgi:hypothetical protein
MRLSADAQQWISWPPAPRGSRQTASIAQKTKKADANASLVGHYVAIVQKVSAAHPTGTFHA